MRRLRRATAAVLATALCGLAAAAASAAPTAVATGLDNPRGLAFGADGTLYVAEAGRGGTGPCFTNSEPNFVCFGTTGAITQVRDGVQSRLVTGLPSLAAQSGPTPGGGATGPNDISLLGNGAIAVTLGLGAPPATVAPGGLLAGTGLGSVIRLNGHSGQWRSLADVAAYEASANPDGTDLDTNPYGLLALPGRTIVADAGGNSVLEVSASGGISTIAAFPQTPFTVPFPGSMDAVPTAVAQGPDGAIYVAQLTGFPFPVGGSTVWRVGPAGLEPFRTGFTNVVDLTFGADGSLYVVQIDSAGLATPPPHPPIGSLIRVAPDGTRSTVAAGLFAPGGVAFGPDGAPYLTVCSVCAGGGQVLRLG